MRGHGDTNETGMDGTRVRPRRRLRWLVALLAAAAALAGGGWVLAGWAAGPSGLVFDACVANTDTDGCTALPVQALSGARSVAVSPDGKSVYVTADKNRAVTAFRRDAAGRVFFDGCVAQTGAGGCTDPPGSSLEGSLDVEISLDGKSVYVPAGASQAVNVFRRDGEGRLFFDGCVANTTVDGCTALPVQALSGAGSVAVSPDGKSLYVTGTNKDAVAVFRRDGEGRLFFDGCVANAGAGGCTDLPGSPLADPVEAAVSPDGKSVYVTGRVSGSIAVFRRDGEGRLFFDGCVANAGAGGCTDVPGSPLEDPRGLAVSPDGGFVYVAASDSQSVTVFRRDGEGRLFFDGCVANAGAGGCTDLPGSPLGGGGDIRLALSPDGSFAYVVSGIRASLTVFRRDAGGRLFFDGCVADTGADGCTDLPATPLTGASGVAVSRDGKAVYVASGSSLSTFLRVGGAASPPPPPPPGSPPPPPAGSSPPRAGGRALCQGRAATIVGTARNDTLRGTRRSDVIAGRGGNDRILGLGGDDILCGGAGDDRLAGGAGNDRLAGGAGDDVLTGGPGADRLTGGPGIDTLAGGPGNNKEQQ